MAHSARELNVRLIILAMTAWAMVGCASARRGVPVKGPLALNDQARQGQVLFMRHCNQCHPGGEAGVGTAINNKSVPHAVMKLQIRNGVLGSMPKFPDSVISDEDVDRILAYTDALSDHGS
jgi:mono/diheme cytochrome c family protein